MSAKLPERTGTENPATSGQLEASSKRGSSNNGASLETGYKVVSVSKYEPAIDSHATPDTARQHVKGVHGKNAPAEAHQVAGVPGRSA